MRLDKYLKVARVLKRRVVAKELAEKERLKINDRIAKASNEVNIGDIIAKTVIPAITNIKAKIFINVFNFFFFFFLLFLFEFFGWF